MPDGTVEIITGKERRRRWSVEEKLRIVAEAEEPGVRIAEVAARHEVYPSLLFNWRRQVREGRLGPRCLEHVRAVGIDRGRGHLVHQARLAQLVREVGRTTVQHVAGYERQRRHAALVASVLDITASLMDQAIDLFDRLVGAMFRKAEGRQARAFQADARAINEKVRLYARIGTALIAARDGERDAYHAITAVISWDRFCKTVAEADPSLDVPHSIGRDRRDLARSLLVGF